MAAAQGEPNLRSACLKPLEVLKEQVLKEESLAHITQAETESVKEFERAQLLSALAVTGGKRARAAELLGISRKTFWEKLRGHSIPDSDIDD